MLRKLTNNDDKLTRFCLVIFNVVLLFLINGEGAFVLGAPAQSSLNSSVEAQSAKAALPKPLVPLVSRVINSEAKTLGFIAENNLSFSMVPKLIDFAKNLAKDEKALAKLHMDRTSASYKMRFGIGQTFQEQVISELKSNYFSINVDEATSSNSTHVLTILVSYFSPSHQRVVVSHLHSSEILTVNSASITGLIEDVFDRYSIPWRNLVSILSDSCNVMRGKKAGVETRIRESHAHHLLDIDGDTCHHVHNAAKRLSQAFERKPEAVFSAVHDDCRFTDLSDYMAELCTLLGLSYTAPERYVPTRWLSVYTVACDFLRFLDVYTLFYLSFLSQSDRLLYLHLQAEILHRYQLSDAAKERLREIQCTLRKKSMTSTGKERKDTVCKALFFDRKFTLLCIYFYSSVFPLLQRYVKLFQTAEPMIHRLHDEIVALVRHFLASFMKPEAIAKSPTKLAKTSVEDATQFLSDRDIFIGEKTATLLKSLGKTHDVRQRFMDCVRQSYTLCGKYLIQKMPLTNQFLQRASAIEAFRMLLPMS